MLPPQPSSSAWTPGMNDYTITRRNLDLNKAPWEAPKPKCDCCGEELKDGHNETFQRSASVMGNVWGPADGSGILKRRLTANVHFATARSSGPSFQPMIGLYSIGGTSMRISVGSSRRRRICLGRTRWIGWSLLGAWKWNRWWQVINEETDMFEFWFSLCQLWHLQLLLVRFEWEGYFLRAWSWKCV